MSTKTAVIAALLLAALALTAGLVIGELLSVGKPQYNVPKTSTPPAYYDSSKLRWRA